MEPASRDHPLASSAREAAADAVEHCRDAFSAVR